MLRPRLRDSSDLALHLEWAFCPLGIKPRLVSFVSLVLLIFAIGLRSTVSCGWTLGEGACLSYRHFLCPRATSLWPLLLRRENTYLWVLEARRAQSHSQTLSRSSSSLLAKLAEWPRQTWWPWIFRDARAALLAAHASAAFLCFLLPGRLQPQASISGPPHPHFPPSWAVALGLKGNRPAQLRATACSHAGLGPGSPESPGWWPRNA